MSMMSSDLPLLLTVPVSQLIPQSNEARTDAAKKDGSLYTLPIVLLPAIVQVQQQGKTMQDPHEERLRDDVILPILLTGIEQHDSHHALHSMFVFIVVGIFNDAKQGSKDLLQEGSKLHGTKLQYITIQFFISAFRKYVQSVVHNCVSRIGSCRVAAPP